MKLLRFLGEINSCSKYTYSSGTLHSVTAPGQGLSLQRAGSCSLCALPCACSLRWEHWRSLQHCSRNQRFLQRQTPSGAGEIQLAVCLNSSQPPRIYSGFLKLHIWTRVLYVNTKQLLFKKKKKDGKSPISLQLLIIIKQKLWVYKIKVGKNY